MNVPHSACMPCLLEKRPPSGLTLILTRAFIFFVAIGASQMTLKDSEEEKGQDESPLLPSLEELGLRLPSVDLPFGGSKDAQSKQAPTPTPAQSTSKVVSLSRLSESLPSLAPLSSSSTLLSLSLSLSPLLSFLLPRCFFSTVENGTIP